MGSISPITDEEFSKRLNKINQKLQEEYNNKQKQRELEKNKKREMTDNEFNLSLLWLS